MSLEKNIADIRSQIPAGQFSNEASVKQGIVLPLLNMLGWPVFNPRVVSPEYGLEVRRVDYALCHPASSPRLLLEVKDIGNAGGAERQLFEYAFMQGIPMAILTDGQEWSFFLPGEQGDYHERCVYKLDLIARPIDECVRVFRRYLDYQEVCEGRALQAARDDYQNVSRGRVIQNALPQAWRGLLEDEDELLLELLADKVQTLTGFKPSPDSVAEFISGQVLTTFGSKEKAAQYVEKPTSSPDTHRPGPTPLRRSVPQEFSSAVVQGTRITASSAKEVMIKVLGEFHRRDPSFMARFAALPRHGRRRRYVSLEKMELYPGRPDLCDDCSEKHFGNWWIGTNYSRSTLARIIQMASGVAGLQFGRDIILE